MSERNHSEGRYLGNLITDPLWSSAGLDTAAFGVSGVYYASLRAALDQHLPVLYHPGRRSP